MNYEDLISQMYDTQDITPGQADVYKKSKRLSDKNIMYNISLRDEYFLSKKNERDSIINKAKWNIFGDNENVVSYVKERLWSILSNDKIKSIHESLYKGISVHEIVYDNDNKIIDFLEIPITMLKYNYNKVTATHEIYMYNGKKYILIDPEKYILSMSNVIINEFPRGLSEIAIDMIVLKKITLYKQLCVYNDSISQPMLVVKYENDNQKDDARQALMNLSSASKAIMHKNNDVDWLETTGNNTSVYFDTLNLIQSNLSRLITGVVNSGESSVGSYSALESQIKIKEDLIHNSFDIINKAINNYIIPRICEEIDTLDYPTFELSIPSKRSIETDKQLYELGVRFNKKHFIDNYGLNDVDFDLEGEYNNEKDNSIKQV